MAKYIQINEVIDQLRVKIFPILEKYYKEGETYQRWQQHAERDWREIFDLIVSLEDKKDNGQN